MPTLIHVLLLLLAATLLTSGLVLLARATYKRHQLQGTDDVETAYVTALATLYGIFVAFMIFTVWNKYNAAQDAVAAEANQIANIYRLAGGLDEPLKGNIRGLMVDYARSVVDHEWDKMREGKLSPHTQQIVGKLWHQFNRMGPDSVRDPVLRDHLLTAWIKTTDLRRLRLQWASSTLAPIAYALLIVGGLITLGMASIFTVGNFRTHLIKASALGCVIFLMLGVIWGLDHPFRNGEGHLSPKNLVIMLKLLPSANALLPDPQLPTISIQPLPFGVGISSVAENILSS